MEGISDELKALLSSLLNPDVSLRPTLKEILVILFLQQVMIRRQTGYIFDEAGFPDKYSCLMIIIRTPLQVVHSNFCSWTSEDFSDSTDVFDYLTSTFDDVSVSPFFWI